MSLGKRLRELRVSGPAGYRPLRQMAKEAGCSIVEWSHFENDKERPSRDFLARAAPLLRADLGELLRLLDDWEKAPPSDPGANICHKRWTA